MLYNYNYKNFKLDEFGGKLGEFSFSYQDCFCGEKHYDTLFNKQERDKSLQL